MWTGFLNYDHYWLVDQRDKWIHEIHESEPEIIKYGKDRYWNIPASFDIETSSYYEMGEKRATMYVWSLIVNGSTLVGRTWAEFVDTINLLASEFNTDYARLIIYVHNLGYEFQFMRGWLDWHDVFAVKERRPVHATLKNGIEFKCSYILSNYALAYIGENLLKKYPVQKDVGAIDYQQVRHSKTPLTDIEIWYNVHDTQVVCSYIQEKIENEGGIGNIPLTNTGYVRRYCRNACFTQDESDEKTIKKVRAKYHELMKSLQITSKCEYDQLKWAFAGGFTHAAPKWSGNVCQEVGSVDLASSYPAVMVMKKFPMSRSTFIGSGSEEDIDWLTNKGYAVLFTARFKNIRPKFAWENYISVSRCQELSKDAVTNNGRVADAELLQVTITDLDWDIIRKVYYWDDVEIFNLRFYRYGYLPRYLILAILNLFKNKTSLKGVEGKEIEYMVSKNMINSAYGMSVTAIIRDIYEYSIESDDWSTNKADKEEQLKDYNKNYNRFLFYPWGVWVTAHARHNLWEGILEFGSDYVYADTDSIKGLHFENHQFFFDLYNINIYKQLSDMCKYWNIPISLCEPKTPAGKSKRIGVWEYEGEYEYFKTIGAKRYMYVKDNELWFTMSGVNKYKGLPYLLTEYTDISDWYPDFVQLCKDAYDNSPGSHEKSKKAMEKLQELRESGYLHFEQIFDAFNDGLYFPPLATGKQTLTYIDKPIASNCVDYNGDSMIVFELSSIHMEPQSYYLSQTSEYKAFLEGYKDASI
ncbi:MAG: hypothetical protein J6S67_20660 [Methanobrevibacter sp.]|nr:hypothetical protein [Methanobrevibacter sp.]